MSPIQEKVDLISPLDFSLHKVGHAAQRATTGNYRALESKSNSLRGTRGIIARLANRP